MMSMIANTTAAISGMRSSSTMSAGSMSIYIDGIASQQSAIASLFNHSLVMVLCIGIFYEPMHASMLID